MVVMGCTVLIEERRRDAKLIDWLDELIAECPKVAHNMNDTFGAKYPQLPKVL